MQNPFSDIAKHLKKQRPFSAVHWIPVANFKSCSWQPGTVGTQKKFTNLEVPNEDTPSASKTLPVLFITGLEGANATLQYKCVTC